MIFDRKFMEMPVDENKVDQLINEYNLLTEKSKEEKYKFAVANLMEASEDLEEWEKDPYHNCYIMGHDHNTILGRFRLDIKGKDDCAHDELLQIKSRIERSIEYINEYREKHTK